MILDRVADLWSTTGPKLEERRKLADQIKHESREKGERWGVSEGEYQQRFFLGMTPDENRVYAAERKRSETDHFELVGTERVLYDSIAQRLQTREESGKPVIAVDFGGMFGMSFIRIAHALERAHPGSISQKRVIMVVTNLGLNIEQGLAANKDAPEKLRIGEKEEEFVRNNKGLVHYVVADAGELADAAERQGVDLRGNVDVLHENYALGHGVINDIDLPLLAGLMSKGGVFFLGGLTASSSDVEQFGNEREIAHRRGVQTMEKQGMKKQRGRRSAYDIYIKS